MLFVADNRAEPVLTVAFCRVELTVEVTELIPSSIPCSTIVVGPATLQNWTTCAQRSVIVDSSATRVY